MTGDTMRPAQKEKIRDRELVKAAAKLKADADKKRFRPHVNFGEMYEPQSLDVDRSTAALAAEGWVFFLAEIVHEDRVQHWRGRARLRHDGAPTEDDLDVLGLVVGEVTCDDPNVLAMLKEQLESSARTSGDFFFFWFEGESAPASPVLGVLRAMGTLRDADVEALSDDELENMRLVIANAQSELAKEPSETPERRTLLEKLDEAAHIIEREQKRRQNGRDSDSEVA